VSIEITRAPAAPRPPINGIKVRAMNLDTGQEELVLTVRPTGEDGIVSVRLFGRARRDGGVRLKRSTSRALAAALEELVSR